MKENPFPKSLFKTEEEARRSISFGRGSGDVKLIRDVISKAYQNYFKGETPKSIAETIKKLKKENLTKVTRDMLIELFANNATASQKKTVEYNVKKSKKFGLALTHLIQNMVRKKVLTKEVNTLYRINDFVLYFKYFGVPDEYFVKVPKAKAPKKPNIEPKEEKPKNEPPKM